MRLAALAPALALACAPVDDVVFEPLGVAHDAEPFVLLEGSGMVDVPLSLTRPAPSSITARYTLREIDAQSSCQAPDFYAGEGRVEWPAGATTASVSVWVADDDAAELDEALALELDDFTGAPLAKAEVRLVIADDDRSGVVDARTDFGLEPGQAGDQASALAQALARAAELGRGVVQVAAGDYDISHAELPPGTTLSGRGARFHRPVGATNDTVQLSLAYTGSVDSARTLLEGLTCDGRREQQGPYQNDELADSHLVALGAGASTAGRLRAALEGLTLDAGTASGVFVGPQVNATLCRLHCTDLWRDAVTLRGGGSALDVRELTASASVGTTGLWFDGQPGGVGGTHRIDVTIADTELDSGDLELEAYGGSSVELTRFRMARGPLRIQAPDGSVRITDSVLQVGQSSALHNFFGLPHDVTLTRTTLIASPTDADGLPLTGDVPALVAANVRWALVPNSELPPLLPVAAPPHHITFDQCRFERASSVSAATHVYAVGSDEAGGAVTLHAPLLDPNVEALAPECEGCSVEP